jgi:hypothetical protein
MASKMEWAGAGRVLYCTAEVIIVTNCDDDVNVVLISTLNCVLPRVTRFLGTSPKVRPLLTGFNKNMLAPVESKKRNGPGPLLSLILKPSDFYPVPSQSPLIMAPVTQIMYFKTSSSYLQDPSKLISELATKSSASEIEGLSK